MTTKTQDLEIYQLSYKLTIKASKLADSLPEKENKNLTDQIRRAATSITLNITEGSASRTKKEFIYFLSYSYRSLQETKVLIKLSHDLGYTKKQEFEDIYAKIDELGAKLFKFMKSIENELFKKRQLKEGYTLHKLKNKIRKTSKPKSA